MTVWSVQVTHLSMSNPGPAALLRHSGGCKGQWHPVQDRTAFGRADDQDPLLTWASEGLYEYWPMITHVKGGRTDLELICILFGNPTFLSQTKYVEPVIFNCDWIGTYSGRWSLHRRLTRSKQKEVRVVTYSNSLSYAHWGTPFNIFIETYPWFNAFEEYSMFSLICFGFTNPHWF